MKVILCEEKYVSTDTNAVAELHGQYHEHVDEMGKQLAWSRFNSDSISSVLSLFFFNSTI